VDARVPLDPGSGGGHSHDGLGLIEGIEVLTEGAGSKAIVMIHGWPDTHRLWDAQVSALQSRYRCVRFTLPGFDAAPKRAYPFDDLMEALRRVVEQAGAGQRVILLLHDWGCVFGYQFAMRHPALVERIVGVDIGDAGSRAHRAELGSKAKLMLFAYQMWLALAWVIGSNTMARWMARAIGCRTDPRSIHAQMGYVYAMRWLGVAGGFRGIKVFEPHCPMLYLYGERKPFMFHSRAWVNRLAGLPGNRAIGFATGHWIMVQQPRQFNDALLDWLRS
jgi:pimeloyl-ACP methyl ester carboxylesterase